MTAFEVSLRLAAIFLLCLLLSLGLTWLLQRWLLSRQILDRPNERSSHKAPTPRGGGIAVLAVLLPAWALIEPGLWPQLLGALALAAIGWWDDLRGISLAAAGRPDRRRRPRPLVHAAAGRWAVHRRVAAPALRRLLAGLAWLWFVNLFNFMDGIDGIAGSEAASIGFGLAVLALWFGGFGDLDQLSLALVGAVLGFLYWNWHPARIFLGDVGSQALGYLIGFLLLRAAGDGAWAAAIILPLYFWVDATWTLLRRARAGENILAAHAQHFYQQSLQLGRRHDQVTGAILIGNGALILFALGAEMGERVAALAGAGLAVFVLIRRLMHRNEEGSISKAGRN